jgi:hypothetical protein
MRHRSACAILVLLLASACDDPGSPVPDASPIAAPPLGQTDVVLRSSPRPEALWNEYKAIHTYASLQNSLATGQRIDALLSDDARELLANALSDSMRGVHPEPVRARFALDIMRQRLLGESAALRRDRIGRYTAGPTPVTGERATLHVYDGSSWVMDVPVILQHGAWRFESSSNLLANYEELYPLPDAPSRTIARTFGTPQAAARGFARAMNDGTAWDLYDLADSTTKANLAGALHEIGADEEMFIRNLQSVLRTYRADFGTAFVSSVTMTSPDRARVIIAYSKGRSEYLTAVLENDSWHLQMKI